MKKEFLKDIKNLNKKSNDIKIDISELVNYHYFNKSKKYQDKIYLKTLELIKGEKKWKRK